MRIIVEREIKSRRKRGEERGPTYISDINVY